MNRTRILPVSPFIARMLVIAVCCGTALAQVPGQKAPSVPKGDPRADLRPPIPDFDAPVDYLTWHAVRNNFSETPYGQRLYSMLWSESAQTALAPLNERSARFLQIAARQPWSESDDPALSAWLDKHQDVTDAFLEVALGTDRVQWRIAPTAAEWLVRESQNETNAWRTLIPAVIASGMRLDREGKLDLDRLLTAWRASLRYARHVERSGGVVAYMTNAAIRSIVYVGIRDGLTLGAFNNDAVKQIDRLMRAEDRKADLKEAYMFEWIMQLDMIQQLYPSGQFSKGKARVLKQFELASVPLDLLPDPIETAAGVDTYMEPFVNIAGQDWTLYSVRSIKSAELSKEKIAGKNPLLLYYLPRLALPFEIGIRVEADRRAMLLLLSLFEYKAEHGEWPKTLGELNAPDLPLIRVDQMTMMSRDFGYRVNSQGEMMLYTAGFDGTDDRGTHDAQWSRGKSGKDFVFYPSQQVTNLSALDKPEPADASN